MKKQDSMEFMWEATISESDISEGEKGSSLIVKGVALAAEQSKNGRTYTVQNLKENDGVSFNFLAGHRKDYDNPDHNVGEGKYVFDGEKLLFEGTVLNTAKHPDIIEQIQRKLTAVSVQGKGQLKKVGNKVIVENLRIPLLAIVNKHVRGVGSASFLSAIAEKEELLEELEINEQNEGKTMAEENAQNDFATQLAESVKREEALKAEVAKLKEAEATRQKEIVESQKKAIVAKLIEANKELKESDLMEKTIDVLQVMESYEIKKAKETVEESHSEVSEEGKVNESEDVIESLINERNGSITFSEESYKQFNKALMERL